jgi:ATP-dependent Clp protease ATP-binding subunit ClpC
VVELVAEEGFDPEFGARPLRRSLQCRGRQQAIPGMVLGGSLSLGDKAASAEEGRFTFEVFEGTAPVAGEDE